MKKFLEEYGFAILAAIIVIFFIAMSTPVGILVKSQILGLVDKFGHSANSKMDSLSSDGYTATITNNSLFVQGPSSTNVYSYVVYGISGGKEVTSKEKVLPAGNIANEVLSLQGSVSGDGLNETAFDKGSEYYVVVKNTGTGELFSSNKVLVKETTVAPEPEPELPPATIEGIGDEIIVDSRTYVVLQYDGSNALLMDKEGFEMKWDVNDDGYIYSESSSDAYLNGEYYESLSNELKEAIVESSIKQRYYGFRCNRYPDSPEEPPRCYDASSLGSTPFFSRKVFLPSVDELQAGFGLTKDSDFSKATNGSKPIWTRDGVSKGGYDYRHGQAVSIESWEGYNSTIRVSSDGLIGKPTFKVDVSKLIFTK